MKYILLLLLFLNSLISFSQDPVAMDSEELNIESDLIDAMQDVALEDYDNALTKLKSLKNKVSDDGIVDFEIAKVYLIKNEIGEAESYALKAIKKDNSKLIFKQFLLDIYVENKDYSQAAKLYESILEDNSFERNHYYKLADFYQRAKNPKKAIKVLEKLEKTTGFKKEIEMHKINIFLRNRDFKSAMKLTNNLADVFQTDIKVLQKKALIYRLMKKNKKAVEVYKQILNIDPKNPSALSYVNSVNKFNQSEENYIKGLTPILENAKIPMDDKIKLLIPFVTKVSKDSPLTKDMKFASKIILNQYPESAKANSLCADVYYNVGEIEKSLEFYKKSLSGNKNNYDIWKQIMTIYTMMENWDDLSKISEESIDYYPNQGIGYYNAGRAFLNLNDIEKGIDYLDEAQMYTGNKPKFKSEILLMKAHGYIKNDKIKKAKKILNKLDEKFTAKHPYYWELMGDLKDISGDLSFAKKMWEKSLKLGNNTKRLIDKLKK